jgi:hypothetical protein
MKDDVEDRLDKLEEDVKRYKKKLFSLIELVLRMEEGKQLSMVEKIKILEDF